MFETRYFRIFDESMYEAIRGHLDRAWGYPNGNAETCIDPAATAPRDAEGRILLAVGAEYCEWPDVAGILDFLLSSSLVDEISAAEYVPVIPAAIRAAMGLDNATTGQTPTRAESL
jgi:hypothetical protein